MAKINRQDKLQTIFDAEGYKDLEDLWTDSECGMRCGPPAICCNPDDPDCDYIADMEPDQDRGWCPECEANTLKSAYILAGII